MDCQHVLSLVNRYNCSNGIWSLLRKVERLTQVRYRYGAVALKTLLDQQETTRTARLTLVNTKTKPIQRLCDLNAGFGWQSCQRYQSNST